ncbi:MAG: dihydroxyacetone kinase subunit DhaL [Chloroflexota bacterium]
MTPLPTGHGLSQSGKLQMLDIDANRSIDIISIMAEAIAAQEAYLTKLDSTVGDGDHGVNITKALQAAVAHIQTLDAPTLADVWRGTGKVIQNSVGGASGLLFGAFFIGGARTMKEKSTLLLPDVAEMIQAGLAAVHKRGKARPGDKTMVDALAPANEAAQLAVTKNQSLAEALQAIGQAAQAGAESTTEMVARHGRAKFLGERSRDYQDAGATSMAIMLMAWAELA